MSDGEYTNQEEDIQENIQEGWHKCEEEEEGIGQESAETPSSQTLHPTKCNRRTPSGNVIQNTVKSVRKIFSPTSKNCKSKLQENSVQRTEDLSTQLFKSVKPSVNTEHVDRDQTCQINRSAQHDYTVKGVNTKQTKLTQFTTASDGKKRKTLTDVEEQVVCENPTGKSAIESFFEDSPKRHKMDNKQQDYEQAAKELGIDPSTETIDVRTVLKIYHDFKEEINSLKNPSNSEADHSLRKQIEADVNQTMELYDEKMQKIERRLRDSERRSKLTEDILKYQHAVITDMAKRLDNIEMSNARRSATLSGVEISTKKHIAIKQVCDFLHDEMEVFVKVEDTYHIGGQGTLVVIVFQTIDDKNRAFEQKHLLQHVRGKDGTKIYLNNYLPAAENEKKRRERQIKKENNIRKDTAKNEIEHTKHGLKVGSSVYKKIVQAPDPTDLLKYSVDELDELMKLPTTKGQQIKKLDNYLLAYAIDSNKIQQIRDTYFKIRLLHAKARHIVCVYNIPYSEKETHIYQDYCEDGEYGVGAPLLEKIVKSGVTSKAVFIVRHTGKGKIK